MHWEVPTAGFILHMRVQQSRFVLHGCKQKKKLTHLTVFCHQEIFYMIYRLSMLTSHGAPHPMTAPTHRNPTRSNNRTLILTDRVCCFVFLYRSADGWPADGGQSSRDVKGPTDFIGWPRRLEKSCLPYYWLEVMLHKPFYPVTEAFGYGAQIKHTNE